MTQSPAPTNDADRFCLGCGYNLRGLPRGDCPECGQWFDPNLEITYAGQPPMPAPPRPRLRPATAIAAAVTLIALGRLVIYTLDADTAVCVYVSIYPLWLLGCILLIMSVVRNETLTGLVTWMLAGIGIGLALAVWDGPLGVLVACCVGPFAGLLREWMDLGEITRQR